MARRVPFWVPMAAALGVLLIARKVFAWTGAGKPKIPDTRDNREYLTRILLVEAGDTLDKDEWAAIAYAAVNRAERWYQAADKKIREGRALSDWAQQHYPDRGIKAVVDTAGWFGNDEPRARLNSSEILRHNLAGRVRSFVDDIFDGKVTNPIGPRRLFVHPGGMPRCTAEGATSTSRGETRVCRQTDYGLRWLPDWIIATSEGGRAENEPIAVERAVFAKYPLFQGVRRP